MDDYQKVKKFHSRKERSSDLYTIIGYVLFFVAILGAYYISEAAKQRHSKLSLAIYLALTIFFLARNLFCRNSNDEHKTRHVNASALLYAGSISIVIGVLIALGIMAIGAQIFGLDTFVNFTQLHSSEELRQNTLALSLVASSIANLSASFIFAKIKYKYSTQRFESLDIEYNLSRALNSIKTAIIPVLAISLFWTGYAKTPLTACAHMLLFIIPCAFYALVDFLYIKHQFKKGNKDISQKSKN